MQEGDGTWKEGCLADGILVHCNKYTQQSKGVLCMKLGMEERFPVGFP